MTDPGPLAGERICYTVTEDWYFARHWLGVAAAARARGARVLVVTRINDHRAAIEAAGVEVLPWRIVRLSASPCQEAASIAELCRWYRDWRPTIVHQVGLKPILYGSLAARWAGVSGVLNVFAGLGSSFIGQGWRFRAWRVILRPALRRALRGERSLVMVQNADDGALLVRSGVATEGQLRTLPGQGIDPDEFEPTPLPDGVPLVVLAGRLLREKGVFEFVEAARMLRARGVAARFALVGHPDVQNPGAVAADQLALWRQEGIVEVWGFRADMPSVYAQSTIVCLPSYREGFPRVLIEAAAAGRPVVVTDVPGCRQAVRRGETGLLVPLRDSEALARALGDLLADPTSRQRMGRMARSLVEREFAAPVILEQMMRVYLELGSSQTAATGGAGVVGEVEG